MLKILDLMPKTLDLLLFKVIKINFYDKFSH